MDNYSNEQLTINNEHFGYAVPERSRRAVQAIKRFIRNMHIHALYKGDTADAVRRPSLQAVLLYKNVACNDTLGAKRYI